MLNDAEILKLFLPELLIEHFDIIKFEEENKILHIYFEERSTNASAESFNAKIKNFRMQLRGVRDKAFFLFRLSKLFA